MHNEPGQPVHITEDDEWIVHAWLREGRFCVDVIGVEEFIEDDVYTNKDHKCNTVDDFHGLDSTSVKYEFDLEISAFCGENCFRIFAFCAKLEIFAHAVDIFSFSLNRKRFEGLERDKLQCRKLARTALTRNLNHRACMWVVAGARRLNSNEGRRMFRPIKPFKWFIWVGN